MQPRMDLEPMSLKKLSLLVTTVFIASYTNADKSGINIELGFSGGGSKIGAQPDSDYQYEAGSGVYLIGGMGTSIAERYYLKGRIGLRGGYEEYKTYSDGQNTGRVSLLEFPIDAFAGVISDDGKHHAGIGLTTNLYSKVRCSIKDTCEEEANYSTSIAPSFEYLYHYKGAKYFSIRLTRGINYESSDADYDSSQNLIQLGWGANGFAILK